MTRMSRERGKSGLRRGQAMIEWALLLGFAIAFLYAIRGFFTTRMSGSIIAGVNRYVNIVQAQTGQAVASYAPSTNATSNATSNANFAGTGAVTSTSNGVSNQQSTSTY